MTCNGRWLINIDKKTCWRRVPAWYPPSCWASQALTVNWDSGQAVITQDRFLQIFDVRWPLTVRTENWHRITFALGTFTLCAFLPVRDRRTNRRTDHCLLYADTGGSEQTDRQADRWMDGQAAYTCNKFWMVLVVVLVLRFWFCFRRCYCCIICLIYLNASTLKAMSKFCR